MSDTKIPTYEESEEASERAQKWLDNFQHDRISPDYLDGYGKGWSSCYKYITEGEPDPDKWSEGDEIRPLNDRWFGWLNMRVDFSKLSKHELSYIKFALRQATKNED